MNHPSTIIRYLLIVSTFAAWSPRPAEAQQPYFKFKNLSTTQGLSINNSTCILQDGKGFIWIGTRDGLNRYDGYSFTVFRSDPRDAHSISGNFIWSLLQDREGNIWAGTVEGGLNKYEHATGKFIRYTHDAHNPSGISNNTVQSILEDSHGDLWIGTADGLDRLDRKKNLFIHYLHDPANPVSLTDNNIYKIFEDSKGRLWIGTRRGGLDLFNREDNAFRHFRYDPANPRSISDNGILTIFEDHDHDLWIGTDSKGLNLLDQATNTFTRYHNDPDNPNSLSNNTVRCINEDDQGYLWLGTENGGLSLYDKKKKQFYTYKQDDKHFLGVNSNSIWDIYHDRFGNTWLATFGDGVEFLDKQPEKFACYRKEPNDSNSLSNNIVNAFWEDEKGQIWIATDGGGISVLDRKKNSFHHYRHGPEPGSLSSDVILTIKQGRNGHFLIGTFRGGLNELKDPQKPWFNRFPLDSTSHHGTTSDLIGNLLEDPNGNWWIGTWQGGLNYYDIHTHTFTYYKSDPGDLTGINDPFVQSMYQDSRHNLWIGTMGNGLNLLTPAAPQFIRYRHDEKNDLSLSNDIINYILEDTKGRLWIGTHNGLNLFHPATQTFSKYFQKDGLPNNVIQGMLEDKKGDLWISTNNGISRFDPEANTFQNYEYNDGLQGAVFNRGACLKTLNGDMFFGGSRGFNIFNPDSIRANTLVPPVYITDFQVFNESVRPGEKGSPLTTAITEADRLTLSYKQSVFSFEFAALNYSLQEKNQYAYKMEGFDKNWNMVGTQRKATYTNLDPGEYTFRVKASNNDGVWNEKGTSIRIIITPPFWATWWFRTLAAIGVAGGAIFIYRRRMNAIRAEKKKLEERVIELDKAVAQGKFEIASDVLHDIGNAMVGFGSYLTRIRRLQEQNNPGALGELARFFETRHAVMTTAIGEPKSTALVKMLHGMEETHRSGRDEIDKSIAEQLNIISHIQEILHIQRQYISGKHSHERKPVNIRDIIKDCMSMMSSSMLSGQVTVSADIPATLPLIKGDRTKLMQVFLHVMKNSLEALANAAAERSISIRVRQQPGLLIAEIADNGQGIDSSIAGRLFEKGFTTRPPAAGLGLYNCLDIMESHEGTITVKSEGPGKGALNSIIFKVG